MSLLSRLAVSAARAYGALSSNPNAVSASYLVVAGGAGGGGGSYGGGGGAGGYLTGTSTLSTLNTYTVTVGSGGAASYTTFGSNGVDSSISGTGLTTITSTGGGGGGGSDTQANSVGRAGGSGGGGSGFTSAGAGGAGNTPSTSPSQGNNGGSGSGANRYSAGGGGGASAVGVNAGADLPASNGGAGGAGTASSISGSSVTYAGGGGGQSYSGTQGAGGSGGGGAGAKFTTTTNAVAGTANTGGGGGGQSNTTTTSASGGSGVVIIAYTSATPKFVGGTMTTSGGNQIHTFTSSGTLSPLTPVTASYLVVAGGGSGGIGYAGGGGAGGLLTGSTTLYSGATYVVTVGAGGTATGTNVAGGVGGNSVLSGTGLTTLTSTGGGGGAGFVLGQVATAGGSGGGGMYSSLGGYGNPTGGAGTSGQGFAGGTPAGTGGYFGGGGGGSSAVGANGSGSSNATSTGGAGGAGTASSISGSSVTYAGGGGGGAYVSGAAAGVGGSGGGGAGSKTTSTTGESGTTNTGGGGGGACDGVTTAGSGGSGTVIISYAGSQVFNGGLVTTSGGNTIHTFNATGALTPVTNNLNNSLRFRSSSPAYLNRTPSIAGNTQKWTWSAWIKLGKLSTFGGLFGALNGTDRMYIAYNSSAKWQIFGTNAGTDYVEAVSTGLYRDPSAWYHLVIAVDTTQATASNRLKMYVNGNQETVSFTTNMTLNANTSINKAIATVIGETSVGSDPFDGYMTDINFIDGQALEPYYFGNNDAYGNWKPILYKGMYGTNGFYLTFADTSALTTTSNAGLGKDTSGNGNYWATSGISITAGVTYDAMLDVPTNTSATVANYAVANPLDKSTNVTVTNGNLTVSTAVTNAGIRGSMYVSSGKYYWEATCTTKTNYPNLGIADAAWGLTNVGSTSGSYGYATDALKYNNGSSTAYGATYTTGDVIGVALDLDAGTLVFYKNNASQGTAYSSLSGTFAPAFAGQASDVWNVNFGQRPFTYTAPSGFVALNTYNLPTPTILQGNKYMDATLYTGTGAALNVVNQGQFKPDFVWGKDRAQAQSHLLFDSVRGVHNFLSSNSTSAESTNSTTLTSFNSNGFGLGTNATLNQSGISFVGWQWQAGQSSGSSNTSGTITSTVSVSTTAGFSVIKYTGTQVNDTIGHGLGVAPKMVIVKTYGGGTRGWRVYHASIGNTGYLILNDTSATTTDSTAWNNTTPTSTVISLGTNAETNNGGSLMIAYAWAEIAGFSNFGSYTGNGSADGPFVYTGFRPKFVLWKRTTLESWIMIDTSRSPFNVADKILYPFSSAAEITSNRIDIVSNGFKIRTTDGDTNASSATYIYMAFAENPFKNSNSR